MLDLSPTPSQPITRIMATTPAAATVATPAAATTTTTTQQDAHQNNILTTIFDIPIYFHDDWNVGIGGGLWSTGRALCEYFGTEHAVRALRRLLSNGEKGLRIVELGSGNGVLAVCVVRTRRTYQP